MYPELMVIPMREELTRAGIKETRTAEDVDAAIAHPAQRCWWSTRSADARPARCARACAGACQRRQSARPQNHRLRRPGPRSHRTARGYFEGNPPTSPAIAILRDGKLVYLMQRYVIEQATAQQIAGEWSAPSTSSAPRPRPKGAPTCASRHGLPWGGRSALGQSVQLSSYFHADWQLLHLAVLEANS